MSNPGRRLLAVLGLGLLGLAPPAAAQDAPPLLPVDDVGRTVVLYEETAPMRRARSEVPPPRFAREPWRYDAGSLFTVTRSLRASSLPMWARWALLPPSAALDAVRLPLAAAAGLYGR